MILHCHKVQEPFENFANREAAENNYFEDQKKCIFVMA